MGNMVLHLWAIYNIYKIYMYLLISLLYFFIGFLSDIVLNYLSRQTYAPASIKALKVYFSRPGIKNALMRDTVSATYAGLTIVAALLITMFFAQLIFKFSHPRSLTQLYKFLLLAFPIGYLMDILIYKTELFGPTLNPFYKIAGAGFWGAMAYIFAIIVAYFISIN
jgi:hypothetical protein